MARKETVTASYFQLYGSPNKSVGTEKHQLPVHIDVDNLMDENTVLYR
jgi:hypothetical protein